MTPLFFHEKMQRAVVSSFANLISDHHLEIKSRREDLSVVLQSQLCKLTITLDVNNVFATIEPGPEATVNSFFDEPLALGLTHVLNAAGGKPDESLAPFKVTPRRIVERVALLAQLISEHASPMLRGDFTSWQVSEFQARRSSLEWERAMEERSEEWREWRERTRLSEIRACAEQAWKKGQYAEAVRLYESILNQLTPSEAKKLSIARKRS